MQFTLESKNSITTIFRIIVTVSLVEVCKQVCLRQLFEWIDNCQVCINSTDTIINIKWCTETYWFLIFGYKHPLLEVDASELFLCMWKLRLPFHIKDFAIRIFHEHCKIDVDSYSHFFLSWTFDLHIGLLYV